MTQIIERSTKSATITAEVVDRFQAAKKYGIDCWAVYDAVKAGKLAPVGTGKRGEDLVAVTQVEAWLDSLTPRERLSVFVCTRKNCSSRIDKWAHSEPNQFGPGSITEDGLPVHYGMWIEDNRPKMPNSPVLRVCATGEPDPAHWSVYLTAIGDGPWEVGVSLAEPDAFPLKQAGRLSAEYQVPNANDLAAAIGRAVAKRDKLNAAR